MFHRLVNGVDVLKVKTTRNSWGSVVKHDTSVRLIFFVEKEVDELDQKIKETFAMEKKNTRTLLN